MECLEVFTASDILLSSLLVELVKGREGKLLFVN